jgi:hypothetical protein
MRVVKRMFGKAELRAEPMNEGRNKDNSVIEDIKTFFKQCRKPFNHARRSATSARKATAREWEDFKYWRQNPYLSSLQPPYFWEDSEELIGPKSRYLTARKELRDSEIRSWLYAHPSRPPSPRSEIYKVLQATT